MSGSVDGNSAEPDLTPMLDMVFQLVTFFMLVMNFKAASLDLSLKLPVVGSARPVDSKGLDDLLVLNINSAGKLKVYGGEVPDLNDYIRTEATASILRAKQQGQNDSLKFGDELPATVVIRADKATPFSALNAIITLCQKNGFRNFALKAMNTEEGS